MSRKILEVLWWVFVCLVQVGTCLTLKDKFEEIDRLRCDLSGAKFDAQMAQAQVKQLKKLESTLDVAEQRFLEVDRNTRALIATAKGLEHELSEKTAEVERLRQRVAELEGRAK